MQPSIRVALTKLSHQEPERGFDPGSAGYKATTLPFELSSIDKRKYKTEVNNFFHSFIHSFIVWSGYYEYNFYFETYNYNCVYSKN